MVRCRDLFGRILSGLHSPLHVLCPNAAPRSQGDLNKTGVCIRTLTLGARTDLKLAKSSPSDPIPGGQGLMPTKAPW